MTAGLPPKDFLAEAGALFVFVRDRIRYVRDIAGYETLHPAEWILRQAAGDCDDKALLLAALLLSIGFEAETGTPVRFIAMAREPEAWEHVWLQVGVAGRWVDLDATEPYPMGYSVPHDGADLLTLEV